MNRSFDDTIDRVMRVAVDLTLVFCACMVLAALFNPAAAAAQPVTTPWPAPPPNGWCYRGPAPNVATDVTVTAGDCPAPAPDVCPAGRQTQADVCYGYGLGATCSLRTDVTKFERIWGRIGPNDTTLTLFPGDNVFAIIKNMSKTGYLAVEFIAPAGPLNLSGTVWHASTTPGPNLTSSISTSCGDFTPSDARCLKSNQGPDGKVATWKLPGFTGPSQCPLTPGAHYYMNIKMTAPPVTHHDCTGPSCRVNIQNNHTP